MEMPNLWEQLFYIAVIAVSMVFGAHLYRKRHDASDGAKTSKGKKKQRPAKKK